MKFSSIFSLLRNSFDPVVCCRSPDSSKMKTARIVKAFSISSTPSILIFISFFSDERQRTKWVRVKESILFSPRMWHNAGRPTTGHCRLTIRMNITSPHDRPLHANSTEISNPSGNFAKKWPWLTILIYHLYKTEWDLKVFFSVNFNDFGIIWKVLNETNTFFAATFKLKKFKRNLKLGYYWKIRKSDERLYLRPYTASNRHLTCLKTSCLKKEGRRFLSNLDWIPG